MGTKHLERSIIPKDVSKKPSQFKYLNTNPTIMHGWTNPGDEASVLVSIRFCQYAYQCFSEWSKGEMKIFWDFIDKVHKYTWAQLYKTASKGEGKTGFAYTAIPLGTYPECEFKELIDPNITMFELRVDDGKRVHGFRDKSVFYICWLDKDHSIT